MDKEDDNVQTLIRSIDSEVRTYNKMNFKINSHPNLVSIHDVYLTADNMYIVMELCDKNQVLYNYIQD